ncbi:Mannose-6-phosphate receptor binding domain,Glucosidase II beta subunit-like [Cinara cedri]|uniref:Endoplasmic reticulum lectin 1 n=1 Tax=Cinara cedri TaxID=506608 RepID=A0A5E4M367_9HEMI|nr:Mannose-6-phosphate receptor binding domain,Glucosidase II beta subunit-like [Cinara cedri]
MVTYSIESKFMVILFIIHIGHSLEFNGFDDTMLYKINWPGKTETDRMVKEHSENTFTVQTAIGETYQCFLPNHVEINKKSDLPYEGPSPFELLLSLFSKQTCSSGVDTYWIYEVCHFRYVRQYHKEGEGKTQKVQEYYLGRWQIFEGLNEVKEPRRFASINCPRPTKTRKIDGINLPYFEANMSDGTVCDVNGRQRQTSVLYVCYPRSKHRVFSVTETSICQYEIIFLTSFLCSHPWYKPPNSDELNINCFPVDDSPRKPQHLKFLQSDTSKLKKQLKIMHTVKIQSSSETESIGSKKKSSLIINSYAKTSINEMKEFVFGNLCFHGDAGWCTYEICYNEFIQLNIEIGKPDKIVTLGMFNILDHINWLNKNEEKKPKLDTKGKRNILFHFYSSGSICQKTGEKRETVVQYKCTEDQYNENLIDLYLFEPKPCKYELKIESPSLCELINGPIDESGLFKKKDKDINSILKTIFDGDTQTNLNYFTKKEL